MMQFRVFQIPSASPGQADELNAWLRSHRILGVERHFCPDNGGYWKNGKNRKHGKTEKFL